ncbi:MAG: hypothetical protein OIF40_09120 [Mangrovicoccus sp.]|nr:hypothetical protein [Mangrovicoccus sp.]
MRAAKLALAGLIMGTSVQAGGLDRSGQPIYPLFRDGTYAEATYLYNKPSVDGRDLVVPGPIGNVADDFAMFNFAFKHDLSEKISFAIIGAEDFSADVVYPVGFQPSGLGGTMATSNGYSITALGRYKFDENWSVHGGLRANRQDGLVGLGGLAYGPLNGYAVKFDDDVAFGYVLGGAYERKDIALRVALTYNSRIRHKFDTNEFLRGMPIGSQGTKTESDTPQSVNLDFQTGVAPGWLVFGTVRWAEFSEFELRPEVFTALTGQSLVDLENYITYSLGFAHRFNEKIAGSMAFIYEEPGERLVSPLSPRTGQQALQLAGVYNVTEKVELTGILRYTRVGNAQPGTGLNGRVARADFRDNNVLTAGLRIGYYF